MVVGFAVVSIFVSSVALLPVFVVVASLTGSWIVVLLLLQPPQPHHPQPPPQPHHPQPHELSLMIVIFFVLLFPARSVACSVIRLVPIDRVIDLLRCPFAFGVIVIPLIRNCSRCSSVIFPVKVIDELVVLNPLLWEVILMSGVAVSRIISPSPVRSSISPE